MIRSGMKHKTGRLVKLIAILFITVWFVLTATDAGLGGALLILLIHMCLIGIIVTARFFWESWDE